MLDSLSHPPTPGYYAHVPSGGLNDRVVVDYYNGKPSILLLELDEVPVLAWLMQGHDTDVQLWIYVPLVSEEADELIDSPPLLLTDWLARRSGRKAYLGLADEAVLVLIVPWTVPDSSGDQIAVLATQVVSDEVDRALQQQLPTATSRALRVTRPAVRELLSA
jgi:hypothetical protein